MSFAVVVVEGLLLLSIVASCPTSWAQFSSGIEGTVTDPSGAVLPGVKVTLKNEETGFAQTPQTQDTGDYRFTTLPAADFPPSASNRGFQLRVRPVQQLPEKVSAQPRVGNKIYAKDTA
jgi:hypothetical protein